MEGGGVMLVVAACVRVLYYFYASLSCCGIFAKKKCNHFAREELSVILTVLPVSLPGKSCL